MGHKYSLSFAFLSCVLLAAGSAVAGAGDSSEFVVDVGAKAAVFEDSTLDLSKDWGDAQSCVAFSATDVQCFRTNAEADAAVGYVPDSVNAAWDCANGWFCLFEDGGGVGRRLIFSDEYWHRLADWGFANKASSWRNNQRDPGDDGNLGDGNGGVITIPRHYYGGPVWNGQNWNDRAIHVHG